MCLEVGLIRRGKFEPYLCQQWCLYLLAEFKPWFVGYKSIIFLQLYWWKFLPHFMESICDLFSRVLWTIEEYIFLRVL